MVIISIISSSHNHPSPFFFFFNPSPLLKTPSTPSSNNKISPKIAKKISKKCRSKKNGICFLHTRAPLSIFFAQNQLRERNKRILPILFELLLLEFQLFWSLLGCRSALGGVLSWENRVLLILVSFDVFFSLYI